MGTLTQTLAQVQNLLDDIETKAGVSAYLTTPATTTTTVADTWYPIAGTFQNDFDGFVFDTDHIKYMGSVDQEFEIDWHVSAKSDTNATTPHIAIKINGTVLSDEKMGAYQKTSGEVIAFSGTTKVTLSTNDEVQLVCQSDKAGAVLTFDHFNTTINKFFAARA